VSDAYERLTVRSRDEWRAWLADNHASSPGVWLVTYKRGAGPAVPYDDVVEEALAFGWVDSRSRRLDEKRSQLLVTPRRPRSAWSKANKERIAKLEREGLMASAGRAAVATAKANGRWEALDAVERLEEPDDLGAALDADGDARRHWNAFPPSARRAILEWIASARRPETRARRVTETTTLAARNVRANQWPRPKGG
jgi:uncharacterized protein YdeI (YjbR/CyaY-like superfamily)